MRNSELTPYNGLGLFTLLDDVLGKAGFPEASFSLKVDVKEDENQLFVHADAPGVKKEDIKIEFNKGTLFITVEKAQQNEKKEGERVLLSERSYVKRSRSLFLGDKVDESNISAEFKDGVLEIVLPKKESAKVVKQIEVK